MGIMVFLPDYSGDDVAAEMKARGAGDLLDPGIEMAPIQVVKGPGGKSGMLVTFWPFHDPRSYDPDPNVQTWLEAPPDGDLPKGRYWLGYVTAQKPTPEMLQRKTLVDGDPVVLRDNKVWIVPCCEYAPKRLTRDRDSGEETRVVSESYKHWVDWSNALYAMFVSDGFQVLVEKESIVRIPNGLGYAALCLSKNYRVNMDAIDLLQLIGEYEAFEVARVATGMALIERLLTQKKSTEGLSQPALAN